MNPVQVPVTFDDTIALLALFLPLLISFLKQSGFDDRVNRVIALVVYFVWAVGATIVITPNPTLDAFINNFIITLVTGTVAYQMIWSALGIDRAVTDATSVVKPVEEDVLITGPIPDDGP